MATGGWHCEAYAAAELVPQCFFETVCTNSRTCSVRMHGERRRLLARIDELATAGSTCALQLHREFAHRKQHQVDEDTASSAATELEHECDGRCEGIKRH